MAARTRASSTCWRKSARKTRSMPTSRSSSRRRRRSWGSATGFTRRSIHGRRTCAHMAIKLSEKLGEPKWIKMSERIAEMMKEKKNLNANVDFYSATVYYSLGIPTDLFTPDLRDRALLRLVRPGFGATGRQSAIPAAERIRRRTGWQKSCSRSTSGHKPDGAAARARHFGERR